MKGSGVRFDSTFSCDDTQVKPVRPLKSNFYLAYDFDDRGSIYLLNIEENMRNTKKNGPHMTGPNADAAASCGDDTLSQKEA